MPFFCFENSGAIDRLYSWITSGGQDLLTCHYADILEGLSPGQLLLDLNGKAGTGKTPLMTSISTTFRQMADDAGIADVPFLRAVVSAATAMTFDGYTLHRLLHIPTPSSNLDTTLSSANLLSLQFTFHSILYLIIDDSFLLDTLLLFWIDLRCRQIFPLFRDKPFAGVSIVLI